MSTGPCHGFSYEFISQAGVQGMFNLAPGSNHFTEVEVMATCLYTPHFKEVCGLNVHVFAVRANVHVIRGVCTLLNTCGQSCY